MGNGLLWIRTTRHLDTLDELEAFEEAFPLELAEPLAGDDVLIYPTSWSGAPELLIRRVGAHLDATWIDDFTLAEIGADFACAPDPDAVTWRSRETERAILEAGYPPVDCRGRKALFIDLDREWTGNDRLLKIIELALPGQTLRMWHGRSSIVFGFNNHRSASQIATALERDLSQPDIADWAIWEIGNRSISKVPNLNRMADFVALDHRRCRPASTYQRARVTA